MQYESGTFSVQARMCSTNQAHLQYKRGCAVRIRHIFSTSEDVQYKSGTSGTSGTSLVQARMCSTNQVYHQHKRGCAIRARHIFSTSDDVQHKRVDHQVLVQGSTFQKYFPVNESLLLPIHQVKTVKDLWQATKIFSF